MVKSFSKVSFRKYLITAMFKVLSQQLHDTLTRAYERHLPIEDLLTWINVGVEPAPRHLTYCCSYASLSLKQT